MREIRCWVAISDQISPMGSTNANAPGEESEDCPHGSAGAENWEVWWWTLLHQANVVTSEGFEIALRGGVAVFAFLDRPRTVSPPHLLVGIARCFAKAAFIVEECCYR